MSFLNTMYSGLSGLSAMGQSISVTSDNIANVNTVGFRGSRSLFEDILSRSVVGVGDLGNGVRLAKIEKLFNQGAIVGSARTTDLAISGGGFFVVNGTHNGETGNFYTRAGMFTRSQDNFLTNFDGMRVQGYQADANGVIGSTLGDLQVAQDTVPPRATNTIDLQLNLDVSTEVQTTTFDPADPSGTSNWSNSVVVYDSLGAAHNVTIYYSRTGANSYDWNAVVDGGDITGGTAGTPTVIASGSLGFTTDGLLDTETGTTATVDFVNATAGQSITFDFGDSLTTDGGTGEGTTAFSDPFSISVSDPDGYPSGDFVEMTVDPDGIVTATYTNSERVTVGRVALADFRKPEGLSRAGGTLFMETTESGDPLIGFARTGGRGEIMGGALEQSNVDLSTEFVKLINDQRAFQAASRTITTADELMAETINLKR